MNLSNMITLKYDSIGETLPISEYVKRLEVARITYEKLVRQLGFLDNLVFFESVITNNFNDLKEQRTELYCVWGEELHLINPLEVPPLIVTYVRKKKCYDPTQRKIVYVVTASVSEITQLDCVVQNIETGNHKRTIERPYIQITVIVRQSGFEVALDCSDNSLPCNQDDIPYEDCEDTGNLIMSAKVIIDRTCLNTILLSLVRIAEQLQQTQSFTLNNSELEIIEQFKSSAKEEARHLRNLDKSGYVYVIPTDDKKLYKIGKSKDPRDRRAEFRLKLPIKLQEEFTFIIPTEDRSKLESYLHKCFKRRQEETSEFFALTEDDLNWIQMNHKIISEEEISN